MDNNIPEIEETDLTSIYTPPTTDERAVGFVDNVVDFFDDISNAWSQGYAQGKRYAQPNQNKPKQKRR